MHKTPSPIVNVHVRGDITVDWLSLDRSRAEAVSKPYHGQNEVKIYPTIGGAWYVKQFVEAVLKSQAAAAITTYTLTESSCLDICKSVVNWYWDLDLFPRRRRNPTEEFVYRLKRLQGYSPPVVPDSAKWQNFPLGTQPPDILVIEELNAGLRTKADPELDSGLISTLETILKEKLPTQILVLLSRFLPDGNDLWLKLLELKDQVLIVMSSNLLRQNGIKISRRLSWEQTAYDTLKAFRGGGDKLRLLCQFQHLIVRYGVSAAQYICSEDTSEPGDLEGQIIIDMNAPGGYYRDAEVEGEMIGFNSIYISWLCHELCILLQQGTTKPLAAIPKPAVISAIKQSIDSCQRFFDSGYDPLIRRLKCFKENSYVVQDGQEIPGWPPEDCFFNIEKRMDSTTGKVIPQFVKHCIKRIPNPIKVSLQKDWTILKESFGGKDTLACAMKLLEDRIQPDRHHMAPIVSFGNLVLIERTEIEKYRGLFNLLINYVRRQVAKPFCLSVFGSPGTGKSFAVKEISKTIPGQILKFSECNLSHYTSFNSVMEIFIRDGFLPEKIPLFFIDEFDTEHNGHELGWLASFLSLMATGEFEFGGSLIRLPSAIFVFAGGTAETYEDFCKKFNPLEKSSADAQRYRSLKVPDFLSRLDASINIPGVNPTPTDSNSEMYMLRRVAPLHALLQRLDLIGANNHIRVDPAIIQALLKVPKLLHGVRSLEVILTRCERYRNYIHKSSLPPETLLHLHTEGFELS